MKKNEKWIRRILYAAILAVMIVVAFLSGRAYNALHLSNPEKHDTLAPVQPAPKQNAPRHTEAVTA